MRRLLRIVFRLVAALLLIIVLLLAPVGYIELFCQGEENRQDYQPQITDLEFQRAEANSQRYLTQLTERLTDLGLRVRPVVGGSRPATTILEMAEQEQVDLIMLATHGRGGIDRLVMGSVADRVVHHSTCPVFLLPVRSGEVEL